MRNPFRYFNGSSEVNRLTVLMYIRYPLSLRQVEDLSFERGIDIRHETVQCWWNRFGPVFAAEVRKRQFTIIDAFRHGDGIWTKCLSGSMVRPIISGVTDDGAEIFTLSPAEHTKPPYVGT